MKHKLLKLKGVNEKTFVNGSPVEMTLKEIGELPFITTDNKFSNEGYVFGEVDNNYRNDKNMINRTLFPIDIDDVPNDIFDELVDGLKAESINAVVHTSYRHKLKGNRYRVIAETSRTMTPEEYTNAVPNFIEDVPVLKKYKEYIDPCINTKSQYFLAPSHPPETEKFARKEYVNSGTPYIPDTRKRTLDNISSSGLEPINEMLKDVTSNLVEGNRNQRLTSICGGLVTKYLDKDTVAKELHHINRRDGKPPLNASEVDTIIDSIWKKHFKDNPQDKPIDSTQKKLSRFKIITNKDYENMPDMEWLIDGIIGEKSLNMIVGKSQDTKSFLALHMGLQLAHKRDFFGLDSDIENEIPVMYNALEGQSGLKNRIDGWCKYNMLKHPNNFNTLTGNPILNSDRSVDEYIEYLQCKDFKDGLLIIDTYNQATPSMNENDAGATGQVMANCQRIIDATGSALILIHHKSDKATDSTYRGSSAIGGALDTMISVERTGGDWVKWSIEKGKEVDKGTSYKYQVQQIDLGVTAKGKPKNTLIIKEGNITKPKGQRQKLGDKQQFVFDLITDRLSGYPNGDEYNAVKDNVKHMMGEQVPSNKKGNLFDSMVMALKNKKLLKVEHRYPDDKQIIQIIES